MTTLDPAPAARVAWHRRMLEIRAFEDKVQELFARGLVQGTTHLCQGQEATIVGAVAAMGDGDQMTITYRGHGHALARGMSMEAAFARADGPLVGLLRRRRRLDALRPTSTSASSVRSPSSAPGCPSRWARRCRRRCAARSAWH